MSHVNIEGYDYPIVGVAWIFGHLKVTDMCFMKLIDIGAMDKGSAASPGMRHMCHTCVYITFPLLTCKTTKTVMCFVGNCTDGSRS